MIGHLAENIDLVDSIFLENGKRFWIREPSPERLAYTKVGKLLIQNFVSKFDDIDTVQKIVE